MKKSLLTKSPTQTLIAEQAAEIDRLRAALKWYQAQAARRMGEAAKAEIAGAPVRGAGEVPRLIELLNVIKPNFGDVGSRDVEVRAQRERIEAAIAILSAAPAAPAEQAEKLMADMDALRDEYASLSNALAFWLPTVPEQAGAIQDRIVHDVFFLGEYGEPKSAQDLGWITLNVGQSAAPAAPLPELTGPSEALNALLTRIDDAAESYERFGEVCQFEGNPMIYASTLEEIIALRGEFHVARSAASPSPAPAQQQEPSASLTNEQIRSILHKHSRYMGQPDYYSDTEFACLQDVVGFAREVLRESSKSAETAAPGASIGDDAEFKMLLVDFRHSVSLIEQHSRMAALVAFLDQRKGGAA